jgi:hypothetical protein
MLKTRLAFLKKIAQKTQEEIIDKNMKEMTAPVIEDSSNINNVFNKYYTLAQENSDL